MAFTHSQKVLFRHCDPAGIVFYPRYFEMINDSTEAFFETALNHPFPDILKKHGVPTVRIEATFNAPSRHGDILDITVIVEKIGRSSLDLSISGCCDGQTRFSAKSTLVHIRKNGPAIPIPPALRQALTTQLKGNL